MLAVPSSWEISDSEDADKSIALRRAQNSIDASLDTVMENTLDTLFLRYGVSHGQPRAEATPSPESRYGASAAAASTSSPAFDGSSAPTSTKSQPEHPQAVPQQSVPGPVPSSSSFPLHREPVAAVSSSPRSRSHVLANTDQCNGSRGARPRDLGTPTTSSLNGDTYMVASGSARLTARASSVAPNEREHRDELANKPGTAYEELRHEVMELKLLVERLTLQCTSADRIPASPSPTGPSTSESVSVSTQSSATGARENAVNGLESRATVAGGHDHGMGKSRQATRYTEPTVHTSSSSYRPVDSDADRVPPSAFMFGSTSLPQSRRVLESADQWKDVPSYTSPSTATAVSNIPPSHATAPTSTFTFVKRHPPTFQDTETASGSLGSSDVQAVSYQKGKGREGMANTRSTTPRSVFNIPPPMSRPEFTHSNLQESNMGSDRDDLETNRPSAVDFRPAIFSANSDPASAFSFRPSGPSQPSLQGQSSTLQKGKNREIIPDATHGSSPRTSVLSILPSSSAASRIPAPASTSRPPQSASNTSAVPSGSGYRPTRTSGHGQEKRENRATSPAGDSDDMDCDPPPSPKQHTSTYNNGAGTSGGNASRGEGRAYPIPSHEGGKGKTYVSKSSNCSTLRTSKRKDDRKTVLKDIYHRVVKEMLGLTALKDAYLLATAHPDQVRRFNRGDRDAGGPDSDNLLFDWTATLKSDWNQEAQWKISMRVQQLSSDIDLEVSPPEINKYLFDMLSRAKTTWTQHRTKKKNDGTLESPAEAEARISAATELMNQQNRANSRRTNRYARRMDITEAMIKIAQRVGNQGDEEGWTWLRELLCELKAQGMSSDESDAGGAFVVRRLPWRVVTSHHMDFIESRRKQSGICGPRARSPEPRIRREDAPASKRGVPKGLAQCLYDPTWLADQLDSRRAQLMIPESDDEGFQFIELGYNR